MSERGADDTKAGNALSEAPLLAYFVLNTYLDPSVHPSPPVPDILPDASNICTLLIKLGDTFKKVC